MAGERPPEPVIADLYTPYRTRRAPGPDGSGKGLAGCRWASADALRQGAHHPLHSAEGGQQARGPSNAQEQVLPARQPQAPGDERQGCWVSRSWRGHPGSGGYGDAMHVDERRALGRAILESALDAVRPIPLMARSVALKGDTLWIQNHAHTLRPNQRIHLFGSGKASPGMAKGAARWSRWPYRERPIVGACRCRSVRPLAPAAGRERAPDPG